MKKENSTLLKKLQQYSALAAPMLATAGLANAQIVYTDIVPDKTLNADGETYNLDLNNDGLVDYVFFTIVGATYTYAGVYMPFMSAAFANSNEIVGTVKTYPTMAGSVKFGFPYKLNLADQIDSAQPLFGLQDIVFNTSHLFRPPMYSFIDGNPYGNWGGGVTDKYVGFHFTPDSVKWYFGWARCDVAADAKTLVIKDYAYDSIPDEGIAAGAGANVGIPVTPTMQPFRIFSFEGVANVIVSDGKLEDAFITITNSLGQTVMSQPITNKLTQVDLNQFAKGIYLVTVNRGEESFSKKVSFR